MEPKPQTDWSGVPMTAVFASSDGIWPMFFALLNQANWRGSIRNACLVVGEPLQVEERFYFFSINTDVFATGAWSDGMIYVVPRVTFVPTSSGPIQFDEWASHEQAPVVAKIPVTPADFPFLY